MVAKSRMFVFLVLIIFHIDVFSAPDPNWDWTDTINYPLFNGYSMGSPFDKNHAFGLYTTQIPTKDRGWRLIIKRMDCADENYINCDGVSAYPNGWYPFFVIYNIYTGVARHYIYTNDNVGAAQRFTIHVLVNSDQGVFLHNGEYSKGLNEKSTVTNESVVGINAAWTDKWLVFDQNLSYDPNPVKPYTTYDIYFEATSTTDLTLSGTYKYKVSNYPLGDNDKMATVGSSANAPDFVSALKDGYNSIDGYHSNLESAQNFVWDMATDFSDELQSSSVIDESLLQDENNIWAVADFLANNKVINSLPYVAAAYNVFKALKQSPADPVLEMHYGVGEMSLAGTAVHTKGINLVSFPFPNSIPAPGSTVPPLPNLSNNIGLWSMANTPEFVVGKDFIELDTDLYENLILNPESGMSLTQLKAMISVQDRIEHGSAAKNVKSKINVFDNTLYKNEENLGATPTVPYVFSNSDNIQPPSRFPVHNPNFSTWLGYLNGKFDAYKKWLYPTCAKNGDFGYCRNLSRNFTSLEDARMDFDSTYHLPNLAYNQTVYQEVHLGRIVSYKPRVITINLAGPNVDWVFPIATPVARFHETHIVTPAATVNTIKLDNIEVTLVPKFSEATGKMLTNTYIENGLLVQKQEVISTTDLRTFQANLRRVPVARSQYYCDAMSINTHIEHIKNVSIGGTDYNTGSGSGYIRQKTRKQYFVLNTGVNNPIILSPAFSAGAENENWKIWVDYNQDYKFDNSELLVDTSGYSNISDVVFVPITAVKGKTRMRVKMYNGTDNETACGNFASGQVEDFTVVIN